MRRGKMYSCDCANYGSELCGLVRKAEHALATSHTFIFVDVVVSALMHVPRGSQNLC